MSLKSLKIRLPQSQRLVHPHQIFERLTLRGPISSLWSPQAEALQSWHENRQKPDVVVQMNTGGGKTLVGLLIAQSITNETFGKTLYVCPTNQLVEQTAEIAEHCNLNYSTYASGRWTKPENFESNTGPCITNYAAVFN